MTCSAAAAPPFPATPFKNTKSFHFPSRTPKNPLNTTHNSSTFQLHYSHKKNFSISECNLKPTFSHYLFLSAFSLALLLLRLASGVLLPNFPSRWRRLIAFSSRAEAELVNAPDSLFRAAVAYEDRRFFSHVGVDVIGVARAVLSLSARGGGSTITQQLVKNTFLKNERTLLRKFVEIVLAVALERRISKLKILSAYLCKIYWGHGTYGIQSASNFYLGKPPPLLSMGECALLIGMIPAPEVRSPFRDYHRGKTFQARVLKRMVDGGFLDIETALCAMRKSVSLRSNSPDCAENMLLPTSAFSMGINVPLEVERGVHSTVEEIWDWERESKIWEVREEMEKWALYRR